MASIVAILNNNPIILWGGIVLAIGIFLTARHLERMRRQEEELEAPRPSTLDEIVLPKVISHLNARGVEPETGFYLKIGRQNQGVVHQYLNTRLPSKLINPDPNEASVDMENLDESDVEMIDVRIVRTKPTGWLNSIREVIISLLAREPDEKGNDSIYVLREDSFLNIPGDNMVVDGDVMTYQYGGMEVETDTSTRNVVHRAVQEDVSEKLLSSLPNYTEKVDFLFPLHSQKMKEIQQEGEHRQSDEGF